MGKRDKLRDDPRTNYFEKVCYRGRKLIKAVLMLLVDSKILRQIAKFTRLRASSNHN